MGPSRIELDGGSRPTIRPYEQPKDRRNTPANQKMIAKARALLQQGLKNVCVTDYYGKLTLTFTVIDGIIDEAKEKASRTHRLDI